MLLKWCVLPTLFSGKNASPSSSFRCTFSMTALFSLQNGARLQERTSLSTRSFCESILFLHLKALRDGELRLVRTVEMVRLDEILFETLSTKWHQHWDHHHKFTAAHHLHKPMLSSNQYNLDLKPPGFIFMPCSSLDFVWITEAEHQVFLQIGYHAFLCHASALYMHA